MWFTSGMIVGLEFFAFLRLFPEGERGGYQLMTARLLIDKSVLLCLLSHLGRRHLACACRLALWRNDHERGTASWSTNQPERTDRPATTAAARPLADRSSWME